MKAKIYIVLAVIIMIIAGVFYYFYSANRPLSSPATSTIYHNDLLKYSIVIPSGWHVSDNLSMKIDGLMFYNQLAVTAGCSIQDLIKDVSTIPKNGGDAYINQKLQDCIQNSPDFAKMKLRNQEFLNNWRRENAQNVYITRLTTEEEVKLATSDVAFSWVLSPKSGLMAVRASNSSASFSDVQYKRDGFVESMYSLSDGMKGFLTDTREAKYPEISDTGISLSVPITSQSKSYLGGTIKSLDILTTAAKDAQDEKVFFTLA